MKNQRYDVLRNQITTLDVTVNNDGEGEDGFLVKFESAKLENGNSYEFDGLIVE